MRLQPAASLRRVAARRPWTVWLVGCVLAVIVGASVHGALDALERQRATWGTTASVWVASGDIEAGEPVAGRVERRAMPSAVVPAGSLAISGRPSEETLARQHVGAGEIVTEHDVTEPDGHDGLAPRGWVTVAVREPIATGAPIGQSVVVSADGAVLAAEAIVVGTRDDVVLVAVPAVDGPAVAAAATESRAMLLLDQ